MIQNAVADRRIRKTDEAIRAAFLRLLFSVRYDSIGMSGIASEADVSRSTLYQHFPTREHVLQATMSGLIGDLADALSAVSGADALDPALAHFWENRRLARAVFGPPVDVHVRRWLSEAVEERLVAMGQSQTSAKIAAVTAASGTVALLEQWMTGHLEAPRARIAEALVGSATRA